MRLIDADSLRKSLYDKMMPNKMPFDFDEEDNDIGAFLCDVGKVIDEQPTVNEWISYEPESKPENGIYLATCDDNEFPVKRMRYDKDDELWYCDYGIYDGVIYAWMTLPEPYKKD